MTANAVHVMAPAVFHVEVLDRAEFDRIDLPVWDYRNFPIPMPLLIKELTDGSTAVLFKYRLTEADGHAPQRLPHISTTSTTRQPAAPAISGLDRTMEDARQ